MSSNITKSASEVAISTLSPSFVQQPQQQQHFVCTCRICQLVNISEKKRMLCPYCGSFYDAKIEQQFNQNQIKTSDLVRFFLLKARIRKALINIFFLFSKATKKREKKV